jgi:hypothetical protein
MFRQSFGLFSPTKPPGKVVKPPGRKTIGQPPTDLEVFREKTAQRQRSSEWGDKRLKIMHALFEMQWKEKDEWTKKRLKEIDKRTVEKLKTAKTRFRAELRAEEAWVEKELVEKNIQLAIREAQLRHCRGPSN